MATHFVGQRVRVNCSESEVHGKETRILRMNVHGFHNWERFVGHEVDISCAAYGYAFCIFEPHELEPILDRHEPCEAEFKESLDELLSRENNNETVK